MCHEDKLKHLSVAISTWGYRLPYEDNFGGVTAVNKNQV
jgi:hypothetical protein